MRRPSPTLRHLTLFTFMIVLLAAPAPLAAQSITFATMGFDINWKRYDYPVQIGQASRSWTWGPTSLASVTEPYAESPGGQRQVQYFDKARMELNNPAAPGAVTPARRPAALPAGAASVYARGRRPADGSRPGRQ